MGTHSQEQGANFEKLFHELLGRLLSNDLGYDLLQNSLQSSGIQYGKDIQTKWRDKEGQEYFWHFECKSHQDGVLHQREVADKIIDVYRSAHRIEVWCLALAHIEPGVWIDEVFAWGNERLNLPFCLAVLSPERGFIRDLFACHPDLYAQVYPKEPLAALNAEERERCLVSFGSFLREATQRGRQLALRPHGDWELVAPNRLSSLPDSPEQGRAYLRGTTPTCPWESVVYGWTVSRATTERPLLYHLQGGGPGFSWRCIVGAGGEGKSTLLRRVAWEAASMPGWTVIWTDSLLTSRPALLPLQWVEALREGAKVLACIDGSRHVEGVARGVANAWKLKESNKQLVVLMTDRGNEWFRSPTRAALARAHSATGKNLVRLSPLETPEQIALARLLEGRGLLYGKSIDVALERIRVAAGSAGRDSNRPYLLPTIMQLTDPSDRGFETILAGLLVQLADAGEYAALRLLLSTSILHGAGFGLPLVLAERLLGSASGLLEAGAVLQVELEKQHFGFGQTVSLDRASDQYFVHHSVVADGLIDAANQDPAYLKEHLLALCKEIPEGIGPDVRLELPSPNYSFVEILDRIADHLDQERHLFEAAERFLLAWSSLDLRRFPTVHRLAECYLRWLQEELKQTPRDEQRVPQLVENARASYARSIAIAQKVLLSAGDPPRAFANYTYREVEYKAYHGWAVLEGTAAAKVASPDEARGLFLRSVLLALLAFEPHERLQNARACGTLSLTLINLGEFDLAAKVTAASIELRNKRSVVDSQRKMLREHGVRVPGGGIELLDGVFATLCTRPLLREWESVGLFRNRSEHIGKLLELLGRATEWLPTTAAIDAARLELQATRGS